MIHETQAVEFEITNNASDSFKFILENDEPIIIVVNPKEKEFKESAQIEIGEEFSITLDTCPPLVLVWEADNTLKQPKSDSGWSDVPVTDFKYGYQHGLFQIGINLTPNLPGAFPSIGIQIVGTGGFTGGETL